MSKTKSNTKAERDPGSVRTTKRSRRGFEDSRPNRRATRRRGHAYASFLEGCRADQVNGALAFTAPGKVDRW